MTRWPCTCPSSGGARPAGGGRSPGGRAGLRRRRLDHRPGQGRRADERACRSSRCPPRTRASEATNVWGLTEGGTKTTGIDDRVLPRSIVYDASLTLTLPVDSVVASGSTRWHTASIRCGRRAPTRSTGRWPTRGSRPVAGLERGRGRSGRTGGARTALYGAYLSAVAFAGAGSGMHHKICHVLGGMFNLPHAQTHAVVLPHVLAFNAPARRAARSAGSPRRSTPRRRPRPGRLRGCAQRASGAARPRHARVRHGRTPWKRSCAAPPAATRPGHAAKHHRTATRGVGRENHRHEQPWIPSSAPPEQDRREPELMDRVLRSFDNCPDPRLKNADASPRPTSARLHPRDPADRRRVGRAIGFLTAGGTSPTTDGRSSFCSPTCSVPRCRPSRSTTRPTATPRRRPSSGPSSWMAVPGDRARRRHRRRRRRAAVLGRGHGHRPRAAIGFPAPGSRCGRPTTEGFYDVQIRRRADRPRVPICSATPTATTGSGRSPHAVPDPA